jgi:beta-lactamase superfamily II metal-dependent hydrolase
MDLWIFDVGRGLCVAVRSPNGYLCIIDCGCSDDFSPIEWLAAQEWTHHKNFKLAKLIITHPHVDHIADIENITNRLKPFMILRRKDLNWKKVTSGGSNQTDAMKHYLKSYMPPEYNSTVKDSDKPDWGDGFELRSYCLDETKAAEISETDSAYVNNTSYVNIIKYKNYRFALPGDIESEGMTALLGQSQGLCSAIKSGVDFYLLPHHGHASGFSTEWFRLAGATKIMNIASERRKGKHEEVSSTKADTRYSDSNFCRGNNREQKRLVSTKTHGHIHIWVNDDAKWGWEATK